MAKMGRPKVDSPKSKAVGLRLAEDEHEKLLQYASKHDLTITQTVLQGLHLLYGDSDEGIRTLSSK